MASSDVLVAESAAKLEDDAQLESLGYRPELNRVLGRFSSFALQYSSISVLGGLLFGITIGLSQVGPSMLWVWIVGGALQCVVALTVAEQCSAYPVAGSAYNIVSRLGGRLIGWQVGWWVQIAHIASVSSAMIIIAPLVMAWFGVSTLTHWELVGVSAAFILLAAFGNLVGVWFVSVLNNMSVAAELFGAALVIIGLPIAFIFVSHAHVNSVHYLFTTQGTVKGSIILPLLYASLLSVYVVSAFDISGTAGEETKGASRVVPREAVRANVMSWLIGAAMLCTLLFAMSSVSRTLSNTYDAGPISYILRPEIGSVLARLFEVVGVFALFVNGVILLQAGARVMWAQARDGRFPAPHAVGLLNKHRVPVIGIWIGVVIAILSTVYSSAFTVLVALLAVGWAAAYGVLAVYGFRARLRNELPERPFVLKWWKLWYPVAIIWSFFFIGIVVYQDPRHVGLGSLGALIVGLILYYVFVPRDDSKKITEYLVTPGGPGGPVSPPSAAD